MKTQLADHPAADRVQECLDSRPIVIPETATLLTMERVLAGTNQAAFPVVDTSERLLGMLDAGVVRAALEDRDRLAGLIIAADLDIADPNPVMTDHTLLTALQWLSWRDVTVLPVVHRSNHTRLAGIVTEHDLLAAYARTLRSRVRVRSTHIA